MTTNADARRYVARCVKANMVMADVGQETVARRLGMARSTLQLRLSGNAPFTVDEIWALAEILDVDPLDLLPIKKAALA